MRNRNPFPMHANKLSVVAVALVLTACSTARRPDSSFGLSDIARPERGSLEPQPVPIAAPELHLGLDEPASPTITAATLDTEPSVAPVAGFDFSFDALAAPVSAQSSKAPDWRKGQTLLQGFFGATLYEEVERSGGSSPTVDGSDDDLAQVPSLGGGGQWKLGGEGLDFGIEGMLAFNWRSNASAFATGAGGAVIAVDVDLFVFDLYGGPFASVFLGESVRLYAAAGPLMQWADYDQSGDSIDGSGSGFGLGLYARTGLEFDIGSGNLLGFGVRWSDSTIDLDGNQGDLDLQGFQVALTVSRFY